MWHDDDVPYRWSTSPPYPFKFHRYNEINMARSDTIFSKHDLVNKAIVLRVWVTSHPCLKLRSLLLFDMIYTIMAPIKLSLITAVRYTLLSLLSLSFPSFLLFQDQLEFNSSPPSAAYLRQWTGSSLVHVMASRLFGAKPLPEPMLTYCQLDSWEHISVKFESEFYHFHSRKYNWKCRLPKFGHFVQGEMR